MSEDEKPIEPAQPSEQPGTPFGKSADPVPAQPAQPSKQVGTSLPCSEK